MNFKKNIQKRYTTKVYNSTKKLRPSKIEALKEVLRLSPSSINSQPWQFTFVSDKATKEKLAKASFFNDQKIRDCDTLVVFGCINNVSLFEKQIKENLPEAALAYYNNFLKHKPEEQIKNWFSNQVYLALGVFLSACASMHIDSTPMEGINLGEYNNILNTSSVPVK